MKNCLIITAVAGLAIAATADAAPVVLRGQGISGAPASFVAAPTAAFNSKFLLSGASGRLGVNGSATGASSVQGVERELGTLKQVKDVRWAFSLQHSVGNGYSVTMSGIRNGERETVTQSVQWNDRGGPSTSNSMAGAVATGGRFNSLQLTAFVPGNLDAAGLTFTNLLFTSGTLGGGRFTGESLGSNGADFTNAWMTFGTDADLRQHNWSLSGMVLGTRKLDGVDGELNFSIAGQMVTIVPLPAAAWAGLSTMAGLAGVGVIRRRRHSA